MRAKTMAGYLLSISQERCQGLRCWSIGIDNLECVVYPEGTRAAWSLNATAISRETAAKLLYGQMTWDMIKYGDPWARVWGKKEGD